MSTRIRILLLIALSVALPSLNSLASSEVSSPATAAPMDVKSFILEHLADSYEWHVTTIGDKHISIPLPVILKGEDAGWVVFMSSRLDHGHASYLGFQIAAEGQYKGKIVARDTTGNEIRPLDFSITKNVMAIFISCALLLSLILGVARWYKKQERAQEYTAPKGFIGAMELLIMGIHDDVIKPSIGKDYKRYAPYLLTAFFFILVNNLLGLIPIFPGGANVTGNIAVTLILALFTFFAVNIFGSKEYWREILWPDVPLWLKVPIPLMPAIEIIGVFTKPFALMVRLFANILAGHSIILGLTALVFVTVGLGSTINTSMTVVSVIFSVFMSILELLVAYIQAYVFTMLSAVFIGLSRIEPHK